MIDPYGWYKQNYPNSPDYDPRLFQVLNAIAAPYNIYRTGERRNDGGFRPCGDGVLVRLPAGAELATFDGGELTRLVVTAHRYACRVAICNRGRFIEIQVNPRNPDGEHWYDRHPSLQTLSELIDAGKEREHAQSD